MVVSKNTSLTFNQNQKQKQKQKPSKNKNRQNFLDIVFSWTLSDILNKDLYKFQVEELPLTFSSTTHYINSFIYHLFEETRADLSSQVAGISQAPATLISRLQRIQTGNHKEFIYNISLNGIGFDDYEPKVGDLIVFTQVKPKCIDDLYSSNGVFFTGFVTKLVYPDPIEVQVLSTGFIESVFRFENKKQSMYFVVYLTNLTTNLRIWEALHFQGNKNIFQRMLAYPSPFAGDCDGCSSKVEKSVIDFNLRPSFDSFKLDSSQEAAFLSCLSAKNCLHQTSIKLVWGPPGTGKTKTIVSLLFVLLNTKHRTLTCAPTNIAVVGVVKKLLSLVIDHGFGCNSYGFGDIVVFGNEERMKINEHHEELHDVFLDNRIDDLSRCLWMWKFYVNEMILFLENPMKVYANRSFCVSKPKNIETSSKKNKKNKNKKKNEQKSDEIQMSFEEFAMNKFSNVFGNKLIFCIRTLYTHLPTSIVSLDFAKKLCHLIDLIRKLEDSVKEIVTRKESLTKAFDRKDVSSFQLRKTECLKALKEVQLVTFVPKSMSFNKLMKFCLRNACLIFCTASSSIKLCRKGMPPIELVLIDEAAQLKECESVIPLRVSGVRNVVLVGDERQLPSMVHSKICKEAKFGRSLFERLVLLGHEKHLLNVQYRMHPSISRFPNAEFYDGRILDGPNVIDETRKKCFLKGAMYGSFSFINVECATEELDNNKSTKNMVEAAVIVEIVSNLFKESVTRKQPVTVGCISPYKAQVNAIQAKLGKKYDRVDNSSTFVVNVRSIDGFQGSEEDVIIISTVRCNKNGSVGFLSNRQRANVALTRAKHCLWIVGNKKTLIKSGSIWNTLVFDAENRGCMYNARDDKNLAQAMVHALVESTQFGSLIKPDSMLFKEAKWKVNFTDTFYERLSGIENHHIRKLVVSLLVKLSSGWRQLKKNKSNSFIDTLGVCNMLETYNIDGHLYLVWSVDIVYEPSLCFQVLKFWDILSLYQIQIQRARQYQRVFWDYADDIDHININRCRTKCIERNQVVPMSWAVGSGYDSTRALTSQLARLSLFSNETTSSLRR